jgi:hypothetical protein
MTSFTRSVKKRISEDDGTWPSNVLFVEVQRSTVLLCVLLAEDSTDGTLGSMKSRKRVPRKHIQALLLPLKATPHECRGCSSCSIVEASKPAAL